MKHLILNLESPLMAFGGETIDSRGVVRPFPAMSMLTGLIANALGWESTNNELHRELQNNLIFAARIDREPPGGIHITDLQTAQLSSSDKGWTTYGKPYGRGGDPQTYNSPHMRFRDMYPDMRVTLACRLSSSDAIPNLDGIAAAFMEPARPLFIGRKHCLPTVPLFGGFTEGNTVLDAILKYPLAGTRPGASNIRTIWPEGEGVAGIHASRNYMITDQRDWISGLHVGGRPVCECAIDIGKFSSVADF